MSHWKMLLGAIALGAVPFISAAADCPNPFPESPSKADFKACFADIAQLHSETAALRAQIRALEDSLLGPNKPVTNIQVDGGGLTAANCPTGYYLSGLRAARNSGGNYAAQSIVILEAVCTRLFPQ